MFFAPAIIRSEREITPAQRVALGESPGRRPGRLPGGHIDDMVALKQAVALCTSCRPKFDSKRAGYIRKRTLPVVRGRCDGCDQFHPAMKMFVDRAFAVNL